MISSVTGGGGGRAGLFTVLDNHKREDGDNVSFLKRYNYVVS
tara:strand:- start:447 stop:572 length:126 start_codon:yes stop_codon:yes gene_type:complete